MQAFYIENFNFSEAGFIRINQIRTFSKHLFKKKSIPFSRYSSFYTNKNTHTWNKFMGASLSAKKKKKGNIPGKMFLLTAVSPPSPISSSYNPKETHHQHRNLPLSSVFLLLRSPQHQPANNSLSPAARPQS